MNKDNLKQKSVKLKLGTFSTVSVILALCILVALNMVASNLGIFYDLTPDRFYSISDKSKEVLDEITADVNIYTLYRTGEELTLYKQYAESYSVYPNITITNMDPYIHAEFVGRYAAEGTSVPVNSIIVTSGDKFKIIEPAAMYTASYDMYTEQESISSITLERELTNAIRYVTSGGTQTVYMVTGHNEPQLSESFAEAFSDSGFELMDLDLASSDGVPEDASALMVTTPLRDYTEHEALLISGYLENGGKAAFFIDYTEAEYKNLRSVINNYGVDFGENVVLEGDAKYLMPAEGGVLNPFRIIPLYAGHQITAPVEGIDYRVMLANTRPLIKTDVMRQNLIIEPLLTSSEASYLKDLENYTVLTREASDTEGPFDLAYAVTDQNLSAANPSKIALFGTTAILADFFNNGTNQNVVLNTLSWLCGGNHNVFIEPKAVTSSLLNITSMDQVWRLGIQSIVVVPSVILFIGIAVWFRRRNK